MIGILRPIVVAVKVGMSGLHKGRFFPFIGYGKDKFKWKSVILGENFKGELYLKAEQWQEYLWSASEEERNDLIAKFSSNISPKFYCQFKRKRIWK